MAGACLFAKTAISTAGDTSRGSELTFECRNDNLQLVHLIGGRRQCDPHKRATRPFRLVDPAFDLNIHGHVDERYVE